MVEERRGAPKVAAPAGNVLARRPAIDYLEAAARVTAEELRGRFEGV